MAVGMIKNQDSFETIEGISGKAQKQMKQAVKAVGDTVAAAVQDAKQQVSGDYGAGTEQAQQKILSQQQQQQVAGQSQQLLDQTRQNLEAINSEIVKIRKGKEQQQKQAEKKEEKQKEQKKAVEQKKAEEPIWRRMLRKGSHEAQNKVAG